MGWRSGWIRASADPAPTKGIVNEIFFETQKEVMPGINGMTEISAFPGKGRVEEFVV